MLDLLDVAKPNTLKTSVIPDIHRTQFIDPKFELGRGFLSFMIQLSIAVLLMRTPASHEPTQLFGFAENYRPNNSFG